MTKFEGFQGKFLVFLLLVYALI